MALGPIAAFAGSGSAVPPKVKQGRVISQSRRAGRKITAGTKVNVVLSRGPKR